MKQEAIMVSFANTDWFFSFAEKDGEATLISPRLPSDDKAKCLSFRYKSTSGHRGSLVVLDSHEKELFVSSPSDSES